MRVRALMGAGLVAFLVAPAAQASTPYLLPNAFDASGRDHVTVQASLTEHVFVPDIALKSDSFHAVGPDGARAALTPIYLKDVALLELATTTDGTWRISSGERLGRVGKAALVNGEWVFQTQTKTLPEGVVPFEVQTLARSEVYVSRGAPSEAALKPSGQGLEFQALTHPDKIDAGAPARFVLLLDGKPLAGQRISLSRGDALYSEDKPIPEALSDAQGRFTLTPPRPGVYLAMTRHRQAPPAPGAPGRNMTYTLTFEAVK